MSEFLVFLHQNESTLYQNLVKAIFALFSDEETSIGLKTLKFIVKLYELKSGNGFLFSGDWIDFLSNII
jgi:hypothetical protein